MAINKDVVLATGILTVCVVVLAVAFSGPEPDAVPRSGPQPLADGSGPERMGDEPDMPEDDLSGPEEPGIDVSDILGPDNETSIPIGEPDLPGGGDPDESYLLPEEDPGIVIADDTRLETGGGEPGAFNIFTALREEDPLAGYEPDRRDSRPEQRPQEPQQQPRQETSRPASEPASADAGSTYTVASGDSLGAISMKVYGTSRRWREIQKANDIDDPTALVVGQKLVIPGGRSTPAQADRQEPTQAASGDGRSYTVRKGDSFYIIAQRELGDATRWREIQDLNDMDPYDLMAGQTIRLPERGSRALDGAIARAAADAEADDLPRGARLHVVGKGEVLGAISQRYYGTARRWRDIAEANDISDPADLKAGQKLIIPGADDAPAPRREPARTSRERDGTGRTYTIQAGDTLAKIAQRFYGEEQAFRRILEGNPGLNPRRLAVGQRIVLPGLSGDGGDGGDGGGSEQDDDGELRLQEMLRRVTAE
ncbi:MAG: LysM peptidoglycan-binding domain-containing protein [Planctomycetota bacterium]